MNTNDNIEDTFMPATSDLALAKKYANLALKHLRNVGAEHDCDLPWIEAVIRLDRAGDFIEEVQAIERWDAQQLAEGAFLLAA